LTYICDINAKLEAAMRKIIKILAILALLLPAEAGLMGQVTTVQRDTMRVTTGKTEKGKEVNANGVQKGETRQDQQAQQTQKAQQSQQDQKAGTNTKAKDVKAVRSSRPDMTKARGARPPVIVRAGGLGIPKGVGKPTGIGKKGGR
jgi:hypothetical protein